MTDELFTQQLQAVNLQAEDTVDESHLGQFIPLHYHHSMLMSENRMIPFKAAIDYAVFNNAKVLELGGGTGVLSCFAAAKASRVWCVEINPELLHESRRLLSMNANGDKVEVVNADAFEYLPPEPVDVVICEMIHPAMLREKQIEVIEAFKQRYRQRFGEKLPTFIPEAVVMLVQPVRQNYNFFGFHAPIIQFQRNPVSPRDSTELAAPSIYSILTASDPTSLDIHWQGEFTLNSDGEVNALRFYTKNILAVVMEKQTTIDWVVDHLVLPLSSPIAAKAGDVLKVSVSYRAGDSIRSLERGIRTHLISS